MNRKTMLLHQFVVWAWCAGMVVAAASADESTMTLDAFGKFALGLLVAHLLAITLPISRSAGIIPYAWVALSFWSIMQIDASGPESLSWLAGALIGLIDAAGQLSFAQLPSRCWRRSFVGVIGAKIAGTTVGMVLGLLAVNEGWLLPATAALMAIVSLWTYLREVLELTTEFFLLPAYRIHCRGPGCKLCPRYGPVIVIANHAAFFDPLWLGKVLPRRITPMMTSEFYDVPILHWLVKRVVRAIRVQESRYRYEVPELAEAIERLDLGECLVIFPEGNLRRDDAKALRRFGQGMWRILKERPFTPVVACWIDGNWGSFFSHRDGPPMKNKYPDFWRNITVMMREPILLPPEVLADVQVTRQYLMDLVLSMREELNGTGTKS